MTVATYRILTWRGIPSLIKVFPDEGRPRSVPLDDWFTAEIDRLAMREGLVGSDAYLEQFEWSEDLERPGSPEEVAAAIVAELEAEWLPSGRSR